ncbi:hypothetical protein FHW67_002324 [Herbaspirillum sp. Sphag1AN]|nr:hypothetical protein [Herbaspirillum sp. Sphag1AN]MBB3246233.1 hypothetical protein [Herbaspirillum sp. Sphag64]
MVRGSVAITDPATLYPLMHAVPLDCLDWFFLSTPFLGSLCFFSL